MSDYKNLKGRRHVWKIGQGMQTDLALPTFLAYCGIVSALRHVARPKAVFRAILRVENADALGCFEQAAKLFLRTLVNDRLDYERGMVGVVQSPAKGDRAEYDVLWKATQKSQVILLCESELQFDKETDLYVDLDIVLPRPTERQLKAGFKRAGQPLANDDLYRLLSAPWSSLRLAFPVDRPLYAGLRRLRQTQAKETSLRHSAREPGSKLDEMKGFGEAAEWGTQLAQDLADYSKGSIAWNEVDGGVLISGAPGTGKTLFAEVLARTCGVPMIVASSAQWQAKGYLNDFLKAMRSSFAEARSKAPCILFIDEVDSFGDRSVQGHNGDYNRQAINGFLELLDGYERRTGVVVVAATNNPGHLDPAIRRAGRLGRHLVIPLPDGEARLHILKHHSGLEVPIEDMERFLRATHGFSGADLEQLVRDAKRRARRHAAQLSIKDVLSFIPPLVSLPHDFLRRTAFHEAGHAIVGLEVGVGELTAVQIMDEIVPGGYNAIGAAHFEVSDFERKTRDYYLRYLTMLLAGIAAESLVLDDFADGSTGGPKSDLARATELGTRIEACFGMGDTLAVEIVDQEDLPHLRARRPELREAVKRLLAEQFDRATDILEDNRRALTDVTDQLMILRQMSGSSIRMSIEKHRRKGVSLVKHPKTSNFHPSAAAT
ncbi:AAA family ATPase [Neorhizobium sp. T25_27]|uniref:AAA family ATPase n=1 Tax=Neorhizobium sp. T25_27 TaxID=2093831 RepID=UPI000CF86F5A|nr:AAA family ATPase [Neorhizobium sp. T25_27]